MSCFEIKGTNFFNFRAKIRLMPKLDKTTLPLAEISTLWDQEILPRLIEYVQIPNKSPAFDPDWKQHGFMDAAMQLLVRWVEQQPIQGMQWRLLEVAGRTPLLFIEIAGHSEDTVLLYGHMDKQPEMEGWEEGLGPWQPVLKGNRLYGRGAADDGYSLFAALSAIRLVQSKQLPHARCVILIEASEESGSHDLPFYLEQVEARIGTPSLVICLDSGCGDYERLWSTTSLRGNITGELSIKVLKEGIHSGSGGGVVPNPFLILRNLLSRIEDEQSGKIHLEECQIDIPLQRQQEAQQTAAILKESFKDAYPLLPGAQALKKNAEALLLDRTWHAALSVIGLEGLPPLAHAGNVIIPELKVKLSLRTPPTADANKIATELKNNLESNPPFGANVQFELNHASPGWHAPLLESWLKESCDQASSLFFGANSAFLGEGGSIPFMAMLGKKFPKAQFLITGVLGPHSNAHGPNEFLDLPTVKKITGCIAFILARHYPRNGS